MIDHVIDIAREAGQLLREGFRGTRTITNKSILELVTDMDLASERLIIQRISEQIPGHPIIAEERGADAGAREAERYWVIDPLDGTNNYAHGLPFFSVSIALVSGDQPVLGVVYDPIHDECFSAVRGEGAFCNGQPIGVSQITELHAAVLATGYPYDRFHQPETNIPETAVLLMRCQDIRRFGSAALDLCSVAAGRCDGYWEQKLKPWDCAAGALILTEAGGQLSGWAGEAWDVWNHRVVATNGHIHAELLGGLAQARREG